MSRYLLHHQSIQQLISQHVNFVSVVITQMQGSAPQEPGAKMLVIADSTDSPYEGTIGGGRLELFAITHAKKLLAENHASNTQTLDLNLQSDIGMTCGGVVQLFFEVYRHDQWNIAVFGAGHVAQALIPLLLTLSCQVQCIDNREAWTNKLPKHPALTTITHNDMTQVVKRLPKNSYIISVTQGHCEDVKIIQHILADRTPPYIGIIGSDSKSVLLKKELLAAGVSSQMTAKIHCPIGLPLGQDIPAEIAISIAAQLIQFRDNNQPS
ncbi:xanthine dehydrogenase accessory protein XdhC [Marinicella litoralis]|uniref:Molybdenum cofactor sulfurylase n=1 Tax=Marinicella litoralis TaxID=644220 RepID=A0A4V3DI42_9GAMM|nr:xanthine dehydrogenase accessory protein XdhC [Marinicella litoralis]TDR20661.1 molybdenum cofactor sulfurylase [Marinicella litoralis]